MNNIESAREKLDILITGLEEELQQSNKRTQKTTTNGLPYEILKETFEDCSRGTFNTARTTLDNLVNSVAEKVRNLNVRFWRENLINCRSTSTYVVRSILPLCLRLRVFLQ
jgi:hypothetical protein